MQEIASWVTPLLVLPGVGLLLVSTSARYEAIHVEIHALLAEGDEQAASCASHVVRRGGLFRNAMVALYLSAAGFGTAGLVGGVSHLLSGGVHVAAWLLSLAALLCFVYATLQLVREAAVSMQIVRAHAGELTRTHSAEP
jgi:hypothetical protein